MSISLKTLLHESVNYIPPHVDVTKATRGGSNPKTKEAARQLFYDFYAMDFLHRQFGPSHMTTGAKVKAAMGDPNFHTGFASGANWDEVDYPLSQVILNKKFVDVIEHVHEQVTREISRKLMAYLRLGLVQELRHMMSQCQGWLSFRQDLVSTYNQKKTLSKEDFRAAVEEHIPKMLDDIPSAMRLLKFSKYYSKMGGYNNKDPFDIARKTVSVPGKPLHKSDEEPEVDPETPTEPFTQAEPDISVPEEPDDTDYNADISDYPDYEYPSGEFDPEDPFDKKKKLKENYASGRISPSTIKKINMAVNKSGLTWQDIDNAYNKIPWNGSFGGPRWGTGSNAFLHLMPKHKDMDTEEMAALVDHIFDLEHNTGGLLNKGGMNMDDEDLDRRAKATHVARYLPYVSPVVKRLILMFIRYLPGNPEIQKNIDSILNSPTKPFTPEEDKILKDNKFFDVDDARRANIKFFSKKKDDYGNPKQVNGRYYEVKSHTNGKYTVADGLKADIQVFDNFEDVAKYINTFKNDIKSADSSGVYTSGPSSYTPKPKSEKDIYISSHSKIKLPKDKEELLYSMKMGWRPNSKCYKAYFDNSNRFRLYAFTDGSFLCAHDNSNDFKILTWNAAIEYSKIQVQGANDSHQEEAKKYIGISSNTVVEPSVAPQPTDIIYLVSSLEQQSIAQLVIANFPETSDNKIIFKMSSDGLWMVQNNLNGEISYLFSIGKKTTGFGHPYKVFHYIAGGPESWSFSSWKNAFEFIKTNISKLMIKTSLGSQFNTPFPSQSVFAPKELPPNSESNASYKAHVGITLPPKNSIRLTKQDEDAIGALGFEIKMIGQDVWYIHKITKDAVRFYANNLAKLVFTNNSSGIPATLKFDIAKMLEWLAANYTPATTTSPLQTGGSPLINKGTATGASMIKAGGIQAGSIFEKRIANAGFIWDAAKNYYVDGNNVLVIHKDRQSDLNVNGENIHFQNLPDLANFLSDDYADKKKSNDGTVIPPLATQSDGSNVVNEIKTLLKNAGVLDVNGNIANTSVQDPFSPFGNFTLSKVVAIKLLRFYISEKTGKNAKLAECKWAIENFPLFMNYVNENGIPDMNNGYGFILQWAKENPNLTSHKQQPFGEGISPAQYEQVIKPHIEAYGPNIWADYVKSSTEQSAYVEILKKTPVFGDMGEVIFSLGQLGNYYQINDKYGKPLMTFDTLNQMIVSIGNLLKKETSKKEFGSPSLTEDEQDWIINYVGVHKPQIEIAAYHDKSVIASDPVAQSNGAKSALFMAKKTKSGGYQVTWMTADGSPSQVTKSFINFSQMQDFIKNDFATITQKLSSHYTPSDVDMMGELPAIMEHAKFTLKSDVPPNQKPGQIYDNDKGDRITLYEDGTSLVYVNNTAQAWKGFQTPNSLVEWMKEHYGNAPMDEQEEIVSLLKKYNYKDTPSGDGTFVSWVNSSDNTINIYAEGGVTIYPETASSTMSPKDIHLKSLSELKEYLTLKHEKNYTAADKKFHDALKSAGFVSKTSPSTLNYKAVYQRQNGDIAYVYKDGTYRVDVYSNNINLTPSFSTFYTNPTDTAYFLEEHYKLKSDANGLKALESVKDDTEEMEFSNANYNTVATDGIQKVIPLNPQDTATMAKMGFKFDAKTFGYPLYVRGENENFAVYNDNTAHYVNNENGIDLNFHSVKEGFEYLKKNYEKDIQHLFGQEKSKDAAKEPVRIKTSPLIEEHLSELGFNWKDGVSLYVKEDHNSEKYNDEYVTFTDDGKIHYSKSTPNGVTTPKEFTSTDSLMEFLMKKKVSPSGGKQTKEKTTKAEDNLHNKLIHQYGFIYDAKDKSYHKGEFHALDWQKIRFIVDTNEIRYNYIANGVLQQWSGYNLVDFIKQLNMLNQTEAKLDQKNSYIGEQLEKMGFKITYKNSGGTNYFKSYESGKKITIVLLNNGRMRYKATQDMQDSEPLLLGTWELDAPLGLTKLKNIPFIEEVLTYKSIMGHVLE